MISPFLTKLYGWRKWIYLAAATWTVALFFVANRTAHLRGQPQSRTQSRVGLAEHDTRNQLSALQQENDRLQTELKKLPELTATAAQLREQLAPGQNQNAALWIAHSNTLQTAIEKEKRELADVYQWSSDWQLAQQRKAAEERLAEKAGQVAADPEKEYAQTKETLRQMALAQKRLSEIRHEWTQLDRSEKDKFVPRLREAQAQWQAADDKLGQDRVLYQAFPLTNTLDPSSVVFLRSIIPDQNGTSITVYLDGTVQLSK
jgi:hypothetical protein